MRFQSQRAKGRANDQRFSRPCGPSVQNMGFQHMKGSTTRSDSDLDQVMGIRIRLSLVSSWVSGYLQEELFHTGWLSG